MTSSQVRTVRKSIFRGSVAILALAAATPVWAQADPNEPANEEAASDEAIVVTGTLIRGIAPPGTNVVGITSETVQATGASSTNDVLAKVPQITNNFNKVVVTATGDQGTTISRPNIRNLAASGANTTLVLVDGHRIVGAGVLQTTPDPDVVPPAMIERIEIVPDGGSATYGSDAVGGVINIITKKRFDGVEVSGRYGFADDYYQFDVNATVGKAWDSGSIFASYVFNKHDAIFGRDRDYVRQITPSTSCAPGTIVSSVGGVTTTYALPGRVAGTSNLCDVSDNLSFVPAEKRHSVFAGLNQDLSDSLTFDIRAFYTHRETSLFVDQFRDSLTITAANPNFVPLFPGNTSQTVNFSYGPVTGDSVVSRTSLDEWGVTPSFTAELGGGWQLRLLGNYGRSYTGFSKPSLNTAARDAALASTNAATALNPYDISATPAAVLANITNFEDFGTASQDLVNARAIIDGSLFTLPGGDVRVAVGAEYIKEIYDYRGGSHVPGIFSQTTTPRFKASRSIKSVFGELAVPIFGPDNGFTGMEAFSVSLSGRYDDYSDVGGTFNPKVGATWRPFGGLSLRGNYGESFNAPSLADTRGADQSLQNLGFSPFIRPADTVSPGGIPTLFRPTILIAGGNPDLKPQTAKTYSLGADFEPAFIPGLKISGTYYNVKLRDQITIAFSANPAVLFSPAFAQFLTFNPTQADIAAKAPGYRIVGATSVAALYANPLLTPYLLYDARRQNIGRVSQDGIDFAASYLRPTGFGSVNAQVSGTYILNREVTTVPGQTPINDTKNNSRFNLSASLGATIGDFSAQATLYHNAGFRTANVAGQSRVGDFDTVDLFFAYDVKGEGLLSDLSFTLNVNNVFDEDPPFLNSGNGYSNGSTLGRLVQVGVRKKF